MPNPRQYLTRLCIACAVPALCLSGPAAAQTLRLGITGDSNSDEYRANDNRGGSYGAISFGWVEILERLRDVDPGSWGTRSEPRRTGYAYNWARSGAEASGFSSQHSGLSQQVSAGNVDIAIVHIGSNDFVGGDYDPIYNGSLSGAALQQKLNSVLSAIRNGVQSLSAAGAQVLIIGIGDPAANPAFRAAYPNSTGRQRVTSAIQQINTALENDANASTDLAYADFTDFYSGVFQSANAQGDIIVGGEAIDTITPGNEPHHVHMSDGHLGTIASGLVANELILAPLNAAFGTNIPLLTDKELLCLVEIDEAENCANAPPRAPVLSILD